MKVSLLNFHTHCHRLLNCCRNVSVPTARSIRPTMTRRFCAMTLVTAIVLLAAGVDASAGDPPFANDDLGETTINTPVVIDVLANDVGVTAPIDPTTVEIGTAPFDGTLDVDPVTGAVTYTPNAGFYGWDYFDYTVEDEDGEISTVAFVAVDVVDELPLSFSDSAETEYDVPVVIDVLANDVAVDSPLDPTTVTIVLAPFDGTLDVDPITGVVTYTPNAGFYGWDYFEYTVKDEDGSESNSASVDIDVTNDDPAIQGFTATPLPDDVWLFTGTVIDENPGVMQITFGGILDGRTADVQSDGTFEYAEIITPAGYGAAYATTTDELGVESFEVFDLVE